MRSISFKTEITDKPKEWAEDFSRKDLMFLKGTAVYSGTNLNGADISREELKKSYSTLLGKPVRIFPFMGKPTGHGLQNDNTFSENVKSIGFVGDTSLFENKDKDRLEVVFEAGIWQNYYPEIAQTMRELYEENDLKFSVEFETDEDIGEDGIRHCYNINFTGICVVKNPAYRDAMALEVAEEKGGENLSKAQGTGEGQTPENEGATTQEAQETVAKLKKQLEESGNKLKEYEKKISELESEKAKQLQTKKESESEWEKAYNELKKEFETQKETLDSIMLEKLGNERVEQLSKYGEVKEKPEDLAKLTTEEYLELVLERSQQLAEQENKGEPEETAIPYFQTKSKPGSSFKENLKDLLFNI